MLLGLARPCSTCLTFLSSPTDMTSLPFGGGFSFTRDLTHAWHFIHDSGGVGLGYGHLTRPAAPWHHHGCRLRAPCGQAWGPMGGNGRRLRNVLRPHLRGDHLPVV